MPVQHSDEVRVITAITFLEVSYRRMDLESMNRDVGNKRVVN